MRPYIICHMISSLDGRVKADGLPQDYYVEYKKTEEAHDHDGWMCGRITMEDFIGDKHYKIKNPAVSKNRKDYLAPSDKKLYGIVVDPSGKLGWNTNTINGAHIVVALTERVPDEYLDFLKSHGISYLFCGKSEIDLKKVLEKSAKKLNVKNLLLQGGGKMNGSMLKEGLIDELSLLVVPVIEGTVGTASIFDVNETRKKAYILSLKSSKKLKHDILWYRYAVNTPKKAQS